MKTVLLSKIRVVSIVVAMVMIVGTICSLHTIPSNGANTARSYTVYKASTAEEIGTYSLTVEHGEQPSSRAVIGNDEREIDWKKSGVVKIFTESIEGEEGFATGFVVGKHAIATAAHVVVPYNFNENNKRYEFDYQKIHKINLYKTDGSIALTLSTESVVPSKIVHLEPKMEYHVPMLYLENNAKYSYDYAVITVSEDLSKYRCFDLGYVNDSLISSNSASVSITGFPKKVGGVIVNDSQTLDNMYTGAGILLDKDTSQGLIYYDVDTYGGNSGSPVYITEDIGEKTFYSVIGLLNGGDTNPYTPKYNFGVRFNSDILKFYKGNPNIQ